MPYTHTPRKTAPLATATATAALLLCLTGAAWGQGKPVAEQATHRVVVLGSSVAAGFGAEHMNEGWAGHLGDLLEKHAPLAPGSGVTWQFANASVPGDNTKKVLSRYAKDMQAAHPDADIVLIALSLANEGLPGSKHPQEVFDSFKNGLTEIAAKVRAQGGCPVFTLCYPQGTYTPEEYDLVKRMNLLLNSWDAPCVNFLGAIDDGSGHWAAGDFHDDGHPNSQGHTEMFYAIVPSLFDAIVAGKKTRPQWQGVSDYLRLGRDPAQTSPVRFAPAQAMHSFTLSFRVRTKGAGTLAAVGSGAERATLEARDGALVYTGPGGAELSIATRISDAKWHDIALSHLFATGKTLIYLDGTLKGTASDILTPDQFVLGGAATAERAAAPELADYQDLAIYRSAWTPAEAAAQSHGELQQASMEICAPLADAAPVRGAALENRAQSFSQVILGTEKFSAHGKAE